MSALLSASLCGLPWTTRPFPAMKPAMCNEFDEALCISVLEQWNLAAMSHSVYRSRCKVTI